MDRKPYPSESQERFIVRLPDGMRDQIADAAKANNRSMNAEIVARLQQSFEQAAPSGWSPREPEWFGLVGALERERSMRQMLAMDLRAQVEALRQGLMDLPDDKEIADDLKDAQARLREAEARLVEIGLQLSQHYEKRGGRSRDPSR